MAESPEDKREMFRKAGKTAAVLGYTGETGKVLVQLLAKEKLFKKVTLIGRREVPLDKTLIGPEFEQKVIDFERLDDYADTFKDHDVNFCCIGTTKAKVGSEGFKRVDHDYVLKIAELSKVGGTKHFLLMSSMAANHKSSQLYTRTKGQVEELLKTMHFDRLSIFRPAFLLVDRQESRPMEAVAMFFVKPVAKLFPTAITIPIEYVAQAMINNVVTSSEKPIETFENKDIHVMAGKSGLCSEKAKAK